MDRFSVHVFFMSIQASGARGPEASVRDILQRCLSRRLPPMAIS